MTPQEKAFHLHFSFIRDVIADNDKAKICALKVVDEIMDYRLQELDELIRTQNLKADLGGVTKQSKLINYWLDVKHEIEKL